MEFKDFVVVIPSYNNAKWVNWNLESVLSQDYPLNHWRIIYTNDKSNDGTGELVQKFIDERQPLHRFILVNNSERLGALHNLYNMITNSQSHEIIVQVDADDALSDPNVLKRLNQEYQDSNVWMTYGSYLDYPGMTRGCCKPYEQKITDTNSYRNVAWRASHLRTHYVELFNKIDKNDLLDPDGKFFDVAWDCAFQFPMLEMCNGKFKYLHEISYLYNNQNPISDFRIKQQRQAKMDGIIRSRRRYNKLDRLFE